MVADKQNVTLRYLREDKAGGPDVFANLALRFSYILNKKMIKKDSKEWESFISQVELIKSKSNRQVLCAKCWLMLNYEQKVKHLREFPSHEVSILTSAKFASEA